MALTMVKPEEMENQAGITLPPGEWFEIDQERINTFADCTEDHQFIHIDEAAAVQTPLGGTIAHGFLTLSLLTRQSAIFEPCAGGQASPRSLRDCLGRS